MSELSTDLGVVLGRILERSEATIATLAHIEKRMDAAERRHETTTVTVNGITMRLRALERNRKMRDKHKDGAPRLELWVKTFLTSLIPILIVWLAAPMEHGSDVLRAVAELIKALKGGN